VLQGSTYFFFERSIAMPEQLGKIERLEAEYFKGGKKLYVVPLVYFGEDAPDEYKERCGCYWHQVAEQLANLAAKIGKVNRIYHESVSQSGEDGMKVLERLSPSSHEIARTQCNSGAIFEPIEERALLEEVMDWQRCLMLGFMSDRVANKVSELYVEAARKRNESMARKISETLRNDEAGLLFITEGHSVQFPADVEVFSIFPPALDEIHRWLRDQARTGLGKAREETKGQTEGEAEGVERKTRGKTEEEPER
jgi:hypothetical protein